MTELNPRTGIPGSIVARRTRADDEAAMRHLWLAFRHHMSEYTGELPSPIGTLRSERLDRALDPDHPDWGAWLLTAGAHPVGFAVTRALDQPTRVLNSFFLVAPVRRRGLGVDFARAVMTSSPGEWAVAYQERNAAASAFWPRVAAGLDPAWRRETRTPPSRPDSPPDTWLVLTTR